MRSFQSKIISLILLSVILSAFIIGVIGVYVVSGVLHENAEENMHLLCELSPSKTYGSFGYGMIQIIRFACKKRRGYGKRRRMCVAKCERDGMSRSTHRYAGQIRSQKAEVFAAGWDRGWLAVDDRDRARRLLRQESQLQNNE